MPLSYEDVVAILSPDEPTAAGIQQLDASAAPHLERLLDSDDQSLAVKAAFALGHAPSDRTADLLERLAADPRPVMRVAAGFAARSLPAERRESVLMTLLDDDDAGVQKAALASVPSQISESLKARIDATPWRDHALDDLASTRLASVRVVPDQHQ